MHACVHACTLLSLSAVLIYIHVKASGERVDEVECRLGGTGVLVFGDTGTAWRRCV